MRRMTVALLLVFLMVAGCTVKPSGTPPLPKMAYGTTRASRVDEVVVIGHATLRGQLKYNGSEPPRVRMIKPQKEQGLTPPEVPCEGWYVDEASKGVRYAVVFLRAPPGQRLPQPPPEAMELPRGPDGQPVPAQVVGCPDAQYEPRVTCLHPRQKLQLVSDGKFPLDVSIRGPGFEFSNTMKVGDSVMVEPDPDNTAPYSLKSNYHTWMTGYVWRMSHPWAAVTNEKGEFELRQVPVLKGGQQLTFCVWHEMLPDKRIKTLAPVNLAVGQTLTIEVGLPE